ncbi:hypothetical protein MG293_008159 [Ovis ammon polii]|uniref:Uncharacterized protein n=1 Tax=Ovis ammon polii TaxID=230172 RepID=A0AAD4YBA2_OVIAM|nr:hypothetical protein MG293_008159 [Ovis ammon polii]
MERQGKLSGAPEEASSGVPGFTYTPMASKASASVLAFLHVAWIHPSVHSVAFHVSGNELMMPLWGEKVLSVSAWELCVTQRIDIKVYYTRMWGAAPLLMLNYTGLIVPLASDFNFINSALMDPIMGSL